MRVRTTIAAVALAAAAVLAWPAAALAQEDEGEALTPEEQEHLIEEAEHLAEENGAEHADVECIPTLLEGGKVDDCNEAPSPILPATDELLWGAITFFVLLFGIAKFGYPAIKKGMEARTERIRSDLQAAESQRTEAETVLADYRAQLADAKAEAGRIIEEARQAADAMKRDQESRLQTELAEMRQRAAADVDAAKTQALADLRSEVAALAIGAAEVVVQRNLDHDSQVQLIENYINQVGAQR